jgi:hypothetical protein
MRIGMLTVRRRSLLAGAAAGLLCGCQSAGTQFATPGVARGDMAIGSSGQVVTSPAFAQIAAGQHIAARSPMPACGQPMVLSSVPAYTGQPVIVGPPVMGSGGLVYPVAYVPASQLPAGTPTVTPSAMAAVPQAMPANTMVQSQPVMLSSVPVLPAAGTTGQPVVTVVNGPNGPQYVITTEVMGSAPPAPSPTPVVTVPVAPAPVPAAPVPEVTTPAPIVEPSGDPPTLTAPPPASVPLPPIPPAPTPLPAAGPSEPATPKTPAPLPPTVSSKPPNGPVLPTAHAAPPSLGSFPPVPATSPPAAAPKLPPPTGVTDDEIPAAPVFIPAPR